ncbi:MAG TPA: hypothetical protein VL263_21580 [Vicinamibacterales bacterium]|nr:hypothetical protein [Vicinamibacterales bacterium]
MNARLVSIALATLAAVAAWLTLGIQAVLDDGTRARLGVLPEWWLLGALWAAFAGVVWWRRLAPSRLWPLALTALVCLPWLPGPIPAAFLIWYDGLATAVWLFAAIGLLILIVRPGPSARLLADPRRAPLALGAIALLLFLAGAWTMRSRLPGGDEPHYLIITQSLLSDGDLQIENNHARGDYFRYHVDELRPDYLERGVNGAIYSIHAPGVSALVAPAFAIAGWPGAAVFMSLLAAVAVALLWRVTWRLTGDASAAWLAASAFAFTGPGYFHAFTIFPDGAGAAAIAVALWGTVRLECGGRISARQLVAVGSALAMLPWFHTRFAVLAAGFGLILLLRLWRLEDRVRAMAAFLVVPIVSAAAWFGFFWVIWGTPNPAAPYGQATQSAWSHLKPALPGLLFDQQFGLIANAPVYAIAFLGFVSLSRRHRRLAVELAVLCAVYTVAVGTYRMWWGGYSAPARFLVAMLPVLTLPLAVLWSRGRPATRALTLVLLAISIVLIVPRVIVDGGGLAYNERDGYDLLLDWVNRSVNLPLAWPSLHRDVVADAWRDIIAWSVTGTVVVAGAMWIANRAGQAWTWMCGAVALTIMIASSVVWKGPDEAVTPNTSSLSLLDAWPGRPAGPGWQSSPFRLAEAQPVPEGLLIGSTRRGPRLSRNSALLNAPLVPGGQYELVVDSARPEGQLTVTVGRTTQVLDEMQLDDRPADAGIDVIELPAKVHSLMIQGDDRARRAVKTLMLRPRTVGNAPGAKASIVLRASRYGPLRMFFFDDNAFVEPPGFWTRGNSTADIFIDTLRPEPAGSETGHATLRLRAGPVASSVELSSGDWRETATLEAGAEKEISLPEGRPGGWALRLETRAGFRPAQHDPGNKDMRNLGVWVEVVP